MWLAQGPVTRTEWLEGGVLKRKEAACLGPGARLEGPKGAASILQAFLRVGVVPQGAKRFPWDCLG